ncbi:hypothetical protein ABZ319_03995 [Nocardia sp. NPDC005978]|uniref:hypothetical protein n=1 Tax=Nocardia sp. NPDC005978 TaxID=3156725 RepID=UPI0033BDDE88
MVFLSLLLVMPMLCWTLAAETRSGRVVGLSVLAVLALAQLTAAMGWLGADCRITAGVALTAVVMIVLIVAPVLDTAVTAPTDPKTRARILIGRISIACYCVLTGLALLAASVMIGISGRPAWVPATDALGPMPAGLSVSETADLGCTPRSSASSCDREFVITGTATTPDLTSAQIRDHLESTAGWAFTSTTSSARGERDSYRGACQLRGWGLDRYTTCMWISVRDPDKVIVHLSYQDNW